MVKSHQIKLYPTKSQEVLLRKSCGVARYSYNWALTTWKEMYECGGKPSAYTLIKLQNELKRDNWPFFLEVSKTAPQYAIHNLESAYKKMWKEKSGYPKYKKKGVRDSFVAIENTKQFRNYVNKIHIPRIGKIKAAEALRFEGKVNNVVVKRIADMWFAVINIEVVPAETPIVNENQVIIGVDAGIKSMLVTSDGRYFENQKALKKRLKQLKRRQRSLSRKVKGSNNRRKQQMKVARLHYKISCIRKTAIHKATTAIVNSADVIVIEKLNIAGMIKNRKLAQAIGDAAMGEAHRQIKYKAAWQNKIVIQADTFFPSSKLCCKCGCKNDQLKLSDRVFECLNCGNVIDRDRNAANNLENYGTEKYAETIRKENASGFGSSVEAIQHSPKLKEEINNLSNKIVHKCTDY